MDYRIVHWVMKNNSGMHNMAEGISAAERILGLDSVVLDCFNTEDIAAGAGADINTVHTHLPDAIKGGKVVWVSHGTPEHCFQTAVEAGLNKGYGAGDPWMIAQYWLGKADAVITFWDRHQWIWEAIAHRAVDLLPLGLDKSFWHPVESRGHYAGNPAVITAENCHYIKWPLDLVMAWPFVADGSDDARLHILYLPRDQHRWWFPLVNANGTSFKAYISETPLGPEDLRNAFCSCDYYVNMVRYGDHNLIGMQAKACGCKVISFVGNQYADYWVSEGDQRKMVIEMLSIFSGVEPLQSKEVPSIMETASGMVSVYHRLLGGGK